MKRRQPAFLPAKEGPARARGTPWARPSWPAFLAGLVVAGTGACSTVHLDDPPADVNMCRPSQMFFVDRVWPEFLGKDYGGKTCGDANCHDANSGLRLHVVMPTSTPTFPFMGQSDWDVSYRSVTQQLTCSNVRGSELFTRPSGLRTHGGGKLIEPDGPEGQLLEDWVAASP